MIGSGTQLDPWIPLTAEELNDAWSIQGGYIELTCDINMFDIALGASKSTNPPSVNLNGFNIKIKNFVTAILNYGSDYFFMCNGVITVSADVNRSFYFTAGFNGNKLKNILLINESRFISYLSNASQLKKENIACINTRINQSSLNGYSCVYQPNQINERFFYVIGMASASHLAENGFPTDIWYINDYLGGKNLSIEKTGVAFVSGVTSFNGLPLKMEVNIISSEKSILWRGLSDSQGKFTINLGVYNKPVSVFSTDFINKKLRSYDKYTKGDVAITYPDNGLKFTCIADGVTDVMPDSLPSTGVITLGTAIFNVSNINPSACAGPMIPARKYSNYGIKSK